MKYLFLFLLVSCGPAGKQIGQVGEGVTSLRKTCIEGIVYLENRSPAYQIYAITPKFGRDGKVEKCKE